MTHRLFDKILGFHLKQNPPSADSPVLLLACAGVKPAY